MFVPPLTPPGLCTRLKAMNEKEGLVVEVGEEEEEESFE